MCALRWEPEVHGDLTPKMHLLSDHELCRIKEGGRSPWWDLTIASGPLAIQSLLLSLDIIKHILSNGELPISSPNYFTFILGCVFSSLAVTFAVVYWRNKIDIDTLIKEIQDRPALGLSASDYGELPSSQTEPQITEQVKRDVPEVDAVTEDRSVLKNWEAKGGPTEGENGTPKNTSVQKLKLDGRVLNTFSVTIKPLDYLQRWRAGVTLIDESRDKEFMFHIAVGGREPFGDRPFFRSTPTDKAGDSEFDKDGEITTVSRSGLVIHPTRYNLNIVRGERYITFYVNGQECDNLPVDEFDIDRIDLKAWGDKLPHKIFFQGIDLQLK